MFDNLTGLGYSLVTFAIVIGVGTVMLYNFGGAVATCTTDYSYSSSLDKCVNSTGGDPTDPTGAWVNTNYLNGQLGQSGLAGWTPAIVAFSVGMLFLGAFFIKKGRRY